MSDHIHMIIKINRAEPSPSCNMRTIYKVSNLPSLCRRKYALKSIGAVDNSIATIVLLQLLDFVKFEANKCSLLKLAFTSSFGLLFALYAGFFVMLSFTKLGEYTASCTLSFKSSQRTVKRFIVLDFNFCHIFPLPPLSAKRIFLYLKYYTSRMSICQELCK